MTIASGLMKGHHVLTVSIFLIGAVLVVGAAACDGADSYQLTISSGSGGSVPTLGEGTFTYNAGTVVQLVAEPDDGYEFHLWTGDTQGIANPNGASTSITMNGNYAIVANFQIESQIGPTNGGNGGRPQY